MSHPLLARLRDPDPAVRRAACRDAGEDPSAILLVDGLCAVLADPDRTVARAASDVLVRIGARDAGVKSTLYDALRGPELRGRCQAALTIARLEPPPIKLMPVLLDALEQDDRELRWSAAKLLVEMGRLEGEVLPVLLHFTRSEERPGVRRMTIFALRELAPDRPETGEALVVASRADDLEIRRAALSAFASLFEPSSAVWQRLRDAIAVDRDLASRRIAVAAAGALVARSGDPRGRDLLDAAARSEDRHLREAAERASAGLPTPP